MILESFFVYKIKIIIRQGAHKGRPDGRPDGRPQGAPRLSDLLGAMDYFVL